MERELDLDTFAADLADFAGDGNWPQFLAWAAERGYSEADVEAAIDAINKRAHRG